MARRRWSGPLPGRDGPDLFSMPARPAVSTAPAARPRSAPVPVSSEAIERARLAIAEVLRSSEARQAESAEAKASIVPAPVLERADVVELLKLGVRQAATEKAREGFVRSIADVAFIRFHGWRSY